jgi:UDP-N-acetylglucosamine 2-epimerase (non-hydrolysing)
MQGMNKILLLIGTRPEAIKMAPLILELRRHPHDFEVSAAGSGQHKDTVREALAIFGIHLDAEIPWQASADLIELHTRLLSACHALIGQFQPDIVLVQGDTSTAFAGALAAFYNGITVGHVEAGLRSGSLESPFPEEMHRIQIARLASWHFAPTESARQNLLSEGIPSDRIWVCGNTGIDALLMALEKIRKGGSGSPADSQQIKITATLHRRENQPHLEKICLDLLKLMQDERFELDFVLHPNPAIQAQLRPILEGHARIRLHQPLDYWSFLQLLDTSSLIITDSGGIQEEAPTLGKPVVVLRSHTERSELIELGGGILCDPLTGNLQKAVQIAINNIAKDTPKNPFGDGRAARRIVDVFMIERQSGDRYR